MISPAQHERLDPRPGRRVADPGDRRARLVELTDEGAAAVARYMRVVLGSFGEALSHWSEEDRREAARLLTRLVDDVTAALRARPGDV